MTFKVYSGPAGTDAVLPIHKDRMLFKEFPNFDEALSWASHIKDTGRVGGPTRRRDRPDFQQARNRSGARVSQRS